MVMICRRELLYFIAKDQADEKNVKWFDEKLTFLFAHGGHSFIFEIAKHLVRYYLLNSCIKVTVQYLHSYEQNAFKITFGDGIFVVCLGDFGIFMPKHLAG